MLVRPQIMVLDPALKLPEMDTFNHMASLSTLPLTYHQPGMHGMDSVFYAAERTPIAGIMILGSKANVDEQHAWQDSLIVWLRQQIQQNVPVLGICYGHQLLGHMFGGEVGYLYRDKRKLQGFREVRINDGRLWQGSHPTSQLYVSHCQVVKTQPPDMEIIASSADVPIYGLEHKHHPVWGLQPHPEATLNFIKNQGLGPDPLKHTPLLQFGHSLVTRFLDFAATFRG